MKINNGQPNIPAALPIAKRPEFANANVRLGTFGGWSPEHHIKPVDLCRAGFFYTGNSDSSKCFQCGGGLRKWEVDDDAWVEHARWFPRCAFLRQEMGQAFVDVVQDMHARNEKIYVNEVIDRLREEGQANL